MKIRERIMLVALTLANVACSSIDCPYNSKVEMKYKFVGGVTTLTDTLTVTALLSNELDTLLLNRAVDIDSFYLPVSYVRTADVLRFRFADANNNVVFDTVTVEKQNVPHFESVDCRPSYFHNIIGVSSTTNYIESIEIANPNVTYGNNKANIYIHLKAAAD